MTAQRQNVELQSADKPEEMVEKIKEKIGKEVIGTGQNNLPEALRNWKASACLWEYRYLNYFLVPRTQQTLDYFYDLKQQMSSGYFDALTMPLIPDPKERAAIIMALTSHHLLENDNDLLSITEKGRQYVEWRGQMPRTG